MSAIKFTTLASKIYIVAWLQGIKNIVFCFFEKGWSFISNTKDNENQLQATTKKRKLRTETVCRTNVYNKKVYISCSVSVNWQLICWLRGLTDYQITCLSSVLHTLDRMKIIVEYTGLKERLMWKSVKLLLFSTNDTSEFFTSGIWRIRKLSSYLHKIEQVTIAVSALTLYYLWVGVHTFKSGPVVRSMRSHQITEVLQMPALVTFRLCRKHHHDCSSLCFTNSTGNILVGNSFSEDGIQSIISTLIFCSINIRTLLTRKTLMPLRYMWKTLGINNPTFVSMFASCCKTFKEKHASCYKS